MSDTSGVVVLVGALFPVTTGAAPDQNPTGDVTYVLTGAADTFTLSSNVGSSVVVDQTVSVVNTVNLVTNGGTITTGTGLLNGVMVLDILNVAISGGGDYVVGGTGLISLLSGTGELGFVGTGGTLTVGSAGTFEATSETAPITGFNSTLDTIDDRSLQFSGITGYAVTAMPDGTETVTIADSAGNFSFVTSGAGLATGSYLPGSGPITITQAADGSAIIGAICFLRGTRIATPAGETAVESLAVGDLVATREDNETVFRPVTWVGRRAVDVRRMRGSVDAHPVRIRAGAFAADVPHRDLLVTPDHCVFVDGRLIPARMLVNGGSIVADTSISKYEFFHVELDRHAILVAEGLETESYLDTGNRANFVNVAVPNAVPSFAVDAAHAIWATRAAAPLAVDRATVEPIWRRLVERSGLLGFGADAGVALGTDPALRVVTGGGETIYPKTRDGRVYSFVVPSDATSLRLVSNASRPSEVVGPFVDDRRELGVLVGVIGLDTGFGRTATVAAEFADAPRGWHAPEASYRWTDGDAVLPLNLSAATGATIALDVEVIHAGPYPVARALARAA